MKKIKIRFITQVVSLGGIDFYFFRLKSLCVPALNCHSCPAAVFACPVGALVNFAGLRIFPFITIGILGLTGIIAGRFVCGWICPFGLFQDVLNRVPSRGVSVRLPQKLNYTKYAVLAMFVFAIPVLLPSSNYTFCFFCPAGTLQSTIPWSLMGVTSGDNARFAMRLSILALVALLAIAAGRGFCRLFCPLGAILSFFNRISLFRMRFVSPCNNCGICARKCPVGIDPVKQMNTRDCIRCLECTDPPHLKFGVK